MSWSVGSSALWGPVSKASSENTGRRILIAEDSTANSISLLRTLESLGHQVVLASSGRQALAEFGALSFDLIFMDIEFPEMDAFATIRAIRDREQAEGGHVPIIGMTEHPASADRESCLAQGMDGYNAKPVTLEDLEVFLRAVAISEPLPLWRRPLLWDRAKALQRLEGNEELLREVVGIFLDGKPKMLAQMELALLEQSPKILELAAHGLKAELAYLGVAEAGETARQLEEMGKKQELDNAKVLVARLRIQLSHVDGIMRQI
jgi:two-component system sensor histidine kinase/response regulator